MSESALCPLMADSPYKVQGFVIDLPEFLFCGHSMNIYWWRKWSNCGLAVNVYEYRHCLPSAYVEPVSESHSVMSDSLRPHGLYSSRMLQAGTLEWVAFPFSRGSSQSRDRTQVSRIAGRFFTSWATREALRTCWWLQNQVPCVCWLGKIAPLQDRKNIAHGL